jgi:parvulin-like peptidyl-prolyl isomerase
MLQDYYADREPEQVASVFGTGFAEALFGLKPGAWQGPVESGLGWHLVFVESIVHGHVPAFEEIEADVKSDWLGEQRAASKRKSIDAMRARYEVSLPASVERRP